MIGKVIQGSHFRGLLNYLDSKEGASRIGGNMAGTTPGELAAEFRVATALNPRIHKPVCHVSLSLPKQEWLHDETWSEIADQYVTEMGYENCQYVVYRHCDQDHDHIHIALCRIQFTDGKTVSDSWEKRRAEAVIRQLEQCYQLTPVEPSWQKLDTAPTTGEMRRFERTGDLPVRVQLQAQIDQAANRVNTISELIQVLKHQGIDVRLRIAQQKITGISYHLNGIAFSGSQLGRAYSFPGLQTYQGLYYDHTTGYAATCQAAEFPVTRIDDALVAEFERLAEQIGYEISNLANPTEPDPATFSATDSNSDQPISATDPTQPRDGDDAQGISCSETGTEHAGAKSEKLAPLVPRLQPILPIAARTPDQSGEQNRRSHHHIDQSSRTGSESDSERFGLPVEAVSEWRTCHLSRNSGDSSILQSPHSGSGSDSAASVTNPTPPAASAASTRKEAGHTQPEVDGRLLWQRYSQTVQSQARTKLDVLVARKAFEEGRSLQQVVQMLRHSPIVDEMVQKGRNIQSIKAYITHTVQSAYQKHQALTAEQPATRKRSQEWER